MRPFFNACTVIALLLASNITSASGPFIVNGPNGNTPVKYQNPTITLNFDTGLLGNKTNTEADALVLEGFALWNNVSTSVIKLQQGNDLNADVDISNYTQFFSEGGGESAENDGINPVIFDSDGSIIDDFFGVGQSNMIGGFAASSFFVNGSAFIEGFAVINGKRTGINETQTTLIVAHEIGHFFGLDHTLVDIEEGFSGACTTRATSLYPLMYPVACRDNASLHEDDVISVSSLYPDTDISQRYGQITGKFINSKNAAILGANIWVENIETSDVYSVISDYLATGTGFFSIYLPPGIYSLHANSINTDFNGSSGVGQYTDEPTDLSFQPPHPINPVTFEGDTLDSTEFLTITVNEATDVLFRLDGSGTSTTGNTIFKPGGNQANENGGVTDLFTLLLIILILFHDQYYRIRKLLIYKSILPFFNNRLKAS